MVRQSRNGSLDREGVERRLYLGAVTVYLRFGDVTAVLVGVKSDLQYLQFQKTDFIRLKLIVKKIKVIETGDNTADDGDNTARVV